MLLLSRCLFPNDILCQLISAQPQEDRLTKLIVAGPLGKLYLGDQYRFDPLAAFHDCGRNALAPSATP
jgi:hypothetical protein